MLGGGTFVSYNKILPGTYINFVSINSVNSSLGERGSVAIALPLNTAVGKVIELNRIDFTSNANELLGITYNSDAAAPLREIFCNANKVYVYDLGDAGTVSDAIAALEPYEFNVICAYTDVAEDTSAYITAVKSWRDDYGKKCQVVVYNQETPDHEGVINVVSNVSNEGAPTYALTAWVAGAEAGCAINESCTNMIYNGEYDVVTDKTQSQLEDCITNGEFAFHLVYGDVRVLEDINSLVNTTADKNDDFKSNQTIRVLDQIANDIAKLFNTKYLGKIPNNASGRVSFWGDIVAHHKEMEDIEAIEGFNSELLTVQQGPTKRSIIVNDAVTPVNAMTQCYMMVVVQ